jgi:hypothetical protein
VHQSYSHEPLFNGAPTLLEVEAFNQFQRKLSGGAFVPLTRYHFFKVVDDLKARAVASNREKLNSAICFSLEEDSWSSISRTFAALTGGGSGQCTFVGSYSNKDSEAAKAQADHINQTVLEAPGVDTSRPPNDLIIPGGGLQRDLQLSQNWPYMDRSLSRH